MSLVIRWRSSPSSQRVSGLIHWPSMCTCICVDAVLVRNTQQIVCVHSPFFHMYMWQILKLWPSMQFILCFQRSEEGPSPCVIWSKRCWKAKNKHHWEEHSTCMCLFLPSFECWLKRTSTATLIYDWFCLRANHLWNFSEMIFCLWDNAFTVHLETYCSWE